MPVLEVKARRVGGANYQVPVEVRPERRQTLGIRWIVSYAGNEAERIWKRISRRNMDAANNVSISENGRYTKMAEANRARLIIVGKTGQQGKSS